MDNFKPTPTDPSLKAPAETTSDPGASKPFDKTVNAPPPPPPPLAKPSPSSPLPSTPPFKPSQPKIVKEGKGEISQPPPTKKASKKKLATALFAILIFIFGGVSVLTAWRLRQVKKVTPEEAAAWVGSHCTENCEITVGPGKYGFEAAGMGTDGIVGPNVEKTVSVSIPAGTTVNSAYIFWSGEAYPPENNDSNILVNGVSVDANPAFNWFNTYQRPARRYHQYANLAQIPQEAIQQTSGNITFKVKGFDPLQWDSEGDTLIPHNHGFGIVVVYTGPEVSNSKIILRLWGEWLYLACSPFDTRADKCEGPRSKIMEMSLTDLDLTQPNQNKFAFFFGEGEKYRGQCIDDEIRKRPNHLYYKTTGDWQKLNANTGIGSQPWPACPLPEGEQPGGWWTTRITGVNLDPITLDANQIRLNADSAWLADETPTDGESYTFVGVAAQYPIGEEVPMTCLNLESEPEPTSPGEEITLTCTGGIDPSLEINHFEFRVSIDSGAPIDLSPATATKTNGDWIGTTTYEISDYACYDFECRACKSSDSSECTVWGQAQ